VNAGGGSMLPLGEITEDQYDDTFDRNVKGVLFTVQKALPLLALGSSIILTGSTAGSTGTPDPAHWYLGRKIIKQALLLRWVLT
ncbi:SDR family NAD(P)-dependent oxidoreductase, partial [Rhizobium ruizarguesonis]